MNHHAQNCNQADQRKVHAVDESDSEEFNVDAVRENNTDRKDWILTLRVNQTHIAMKLDTGAQANVISESVSSKMAQTEIACNESDSKWILRSSDTC